MSIDCETAGHVARITINRPDAMNAIDSPHNKAGVLTGAGARAFCAGADLKELIPSHHAAVRQGERTPWTMGGITLEPHLGKPMIAAVNGHALAGGMELALACDIRLCAPNASFGLAETKWALIPGAGGTLAVAAARRAILEGLTLGLAAGLSNERDRFADIMKTDDALEGATAFSERRNPHFQGR